MAFTSKYKGEEIDALLDMVGQGGGDTPSSPSWTGHADVEGLKAIGWTDEDIAYYQAHGVNWNAEDDEYHKVTDDNKALYGVLTADNISSYRDRIVYLPKIDTSRKTNMEQMFQYCHSLVAIPHLDTSNATNMSYMFNKCYSLTYVPVLNMSKVQWHSGMFGGCCSLESIQDFDVSFSYNLEGFASGCSSLKKAKIKTSSKTSIGLIAFSNCYALQMLEIDVVSMKSNMTTILNNAYSLVHLFAKNIAASLSLTMSSLLSKESLLYLINNEAATSAITITLHSYAYTRLAEDADIVAALAAHPNISLAK
jgi:surface protein